MHLNAPALALALVALCAGNAGAILSSAALLYQPSYPRLTGMGQTGVADNSDPSTVFYNPANAVGDARVYLQGARQTWESDYLDDLWLGRISSGVSWQREGHGLGRVGVDVTFARFDYGNAIFFGDDGTPSEVHPFENELSLALAAAFVAGTWEIRAGSAVKRWWQEFGDEEGDAIAFDLGVVAACKRSLAGWDVTPALGVSAMDMGPDIEFSEGSDDPLPTRFVFGASTRVSSPPQPVGSATVPIVAFVFNIDGMEPKESGRGNDLEWGIGSEIAIAQILFVRAGSHTFKIEDEYVSFGGWSVGLGAPIGPVRVRFDYGDSDYYIERVLGFSLDYTF